MHAVISAVSMHVPSVIMQYSHKASGVMEMLGLLDHVWDCRQPADALLKRVDAAWADRKTEHARLAQKMPAMVSQAYALGDLLPPALFPAERGR